MIGRTVESDRITASPSGATWWLGVVQDTSPIPQAPWYTVFAAGGLNDQAQIKQFALLVIRASGFFRHLGLDIRHS